MSVFTKFVRETAANTAVAFTLSLLPIVAATGVAIDYGAVAQVRRQLQDAADAAAIAVAADITNNAVADPKASAYVSMAKSIATANVGGKIAITLDDFHVCGATNGDCATKSGTALTPGQVYVHLAASSRRTMTQVIPVKTGGSSTTIPTSAWSIATASGGAAAYTDIYVLVDVSASMGLGSSAADQKKMRDYMGCAFACHTVNPYEAPGPGNDSVVTAHNLGVTLRIDAVKAALKTMVAQAQAANGAESKVRFAIYTFANPFTEVLPISSTYGTPNDVGTSSIFGAINSLDIRTYNSGTDAPNALKRIAAIVPASGDGKTRATAKTYLFFATDGTSDTIDNPTDRGSFKAYADWVNWNPTGVSQAKWADWVSKVSQYDTSGITLNTGLACTNYKEIAETADVTDKAKLRSVFGGLPTCAPEPYFPGYWNTATGKEITSMAEEVLIMPLDPAWCAAAKAKTNVMTLYTTYVAPEPPQLPYVNYAAYTVAPQLESAMRACATKTTWSFTAADTTTIDAAMQKMFSLAVSDKVRVAR